MDKLILTDIADIRAFGHEIQIVGLIFGGTDVQFLTAFPDERLDPEKFAHLELNTNEWEAVLYQTDVLETELIGPKKAIVRKSQRQIDQSVSWEVFERDGYQCRYCGTRGPLTVDHVDLWEAGGVSVQANLVSACKKCNRTRGRLPYRDWIASETYAKLSKRISPETFRANELLQNELPKLEALRVTVQRSR